MAATPPPSVTPAPTPAPQRGEKATFSTRVDAFVVWLTAAVAQFNAIVTNVYNNAVDAYNSAMAAAQSASNALTSANNAASSATDASNSATSAGVISGATLWASGQTVNQDQAKISPLDRRTYRRRTATGAGTVDPSQDTVNYVLLSADSSSYIKLGEATISSPVAAVNFLNLFSDAYRSYFIEIDGLVMDGALRFRLAINGVPNSENVYGTSSNLFNYGGNSAGAQNGVSAVIELHGVRSTNIKAICERGCAKSTTSTLSYGGQYGFDKADLVSGIQFYVSTGTNFTAGTIKVYGIRA